MNWPASRCRWRGDVINRGSLTMKDTDITAKMNLKNWIEPRSCARPGLDSARKYLCGNGTRRCRRRRRRLSVRATTRPAPTTTSTKTVAVMDLRQQRVPPPGADGVRMTYDNQSQPAAADVRRRVVDRPRVQSWVNVGGLAVADVTPAQRLRGCFSCVAGFRGCLRNALLTVTPRNPQRTPPRWRELDWTVSITKLFPAGVRTSIRPTVMVLAVIARRRLQQQRLRNRRCHSNDWRSMRRATESKTEVNPNQTVLAWLTRFSQESPDFWKIVREKMLGCPGC